MGALPGEPLTLLFLLPAHAELPLPTFPKCGEQDRPDLCPADLDGEWSMSSTIPAGSRQTVRPAELELGSGQWQDRAFRVTTGRWDVLLAVLDSGVDWGSGSYQNKMALNVDELPLPQLGDGTTAADHDVDGNGLVNIQDYANDPRVDIAGGQDVGDWHLDGSDLLAAFSDGVDDDGNGFVDDIAGWDFYGDDNDPFTTYYEDFGTHGDGVIEEMAAEGGDGDGDIGSCPNCAVLMLRTGDTFVTDGDRVAMAMLYAVDRGAAAMNLSLGALTRPALIEEAVAYATAHDVVMVSVAGDENSYHHNQPALQEGMLYLHSIKTNTDDERNGAYSYFNHLNCNNFGPRMDLVAGTSACATGAAALTTGIVGLIKSAALDRGLTLSNDQVHQLLIGTAQDVYLTPEELEIAGTYPSSPGWDPFFGYGRVNAYNAVMAVVEGRIPPIARIDTPRWFDTLDPAVGTVVIDGEAASSGGGRYSYVVEYGVGNHPQTWTELATGNATTGMEGPLATLDLSELALATIPEPPIEEGILARMDRVFAPMVTLRLRVTDEDGLEGVARKSFFVHEDPDLLPGFPVQLPSSAESSPILTDLDGDTVFEIVVADAGGLVHVFDGAGVEQPGFPVGTRTSPRYHAGQPAASVVSSPHDGVIATVAVGDLTGDGDREIVAATGTGALLAWDADGTPVAGFPHQIVGRAPQEFGSDDTWDNGYAGAPTLVDLDGNGTLEIVAAAMDQRLYVVDADGADWGPYPVEVCWRGDCGSPGRRIITSPTVGDVDGDGDLEIALGTNEAVNGGNDSVTYLLDALTGELEDGWPLAESGLVNEAALLPVVGEGHPGSVAFADLDGNGDLELASPVMLGQSPLYHHDQSVYADLPYFGTAFGEGHNTSEPSFATMSNQPAFGDLTGDGVPEYVTGGTGAYYLIALALFTHLDYQHVVAAWDGVTGAMLPGWPRQIEDLQFLSAPAIADVTGDGAAEAILGSGGYLVYAWDGGGALAPGWPKFTGNWVLGSAAVGDVSGDGYLDVVVTTREGKVFAWSTAGRADQVVQWASIHHDPQNTGNYETELEIQAGPPETGEPPAEGCCKKGGAEAAGIVLVGLAWGWKRRRKS